MRFAGRGPAARLGGRRWLAEGLRRAYLPPAARLTPLASYKSPGPPAPLLEGSTTPHQGAPPFGPLAELTAPSSGTRP